MSIEFNGRPYGWNVQTLGSGRRGEQRVHTYDHVAFDRGGGVTR
jgi:hypothetical protein